MIDINCYRTSLLHLLGFSNYFGIRGVLPRFVPLVTKAGATTVAADGHPIRPWICIIYYI